MSSIQEYQKLGQQVYELSAFAKSRNWKVVKVFEEKKAGTDKDRPGLNKALELARGRKVDRFARSVSMLINTLEEFNGLGVESVSLKDKIDTTFPIFKSHLGREFFPALLAPDRDRQLNIFFHVFFTYCL